MQKKIIYFDNNGTTKQSNESITEMTKWLSQYGNPSTNNILSRHANELINTGKQYILNHCGVNKKQYSVLFTSGGSESNSFIIRSTSVSYKRLTNQTPHIIISEIEHNSIIDCCESLLNYNCIELTKIKPNQFGLIDPKSVKKEIRENTCLISIMYSNNEIGSINNIKEIGAIAHKHKIPMHTDAVQAFGKYKINLPNNNIDAISASFHKLYCPTGIGIIIINNDLINGYELESIINGTQQNGLRGGTESPPHIAGAIRGMQINFNNRNEKNKKLLYLRNTCIDKLNKYLTITYLDIYLNKIQFYKDKYDILLVLYGPYREDTDLYVPNTLLLSIVSHKQKFCNIILKKELEKYGIIIAIGSACSTKSKESSHVIQSLNATDEIKRGTIRISFGDYNKEKEIDIFIKTLFLCIDKQIPVIKYIKDSSDINLNKITKNLKPVPFKNIIHSSCIKSNSKTKSKTNSKTKSKTKSKSKQKSKQKSKKNK
jgi:cysteine desulfurase